MKTVHFLLLLTALLIFSCRGCNSYNVPANVGQGGRTLTIDVHPTNERTYLAASESGGLFKTTDGGRIWIPLKNLPQHEMVDARFAPSRPNTILATARADSRTRNGGGIWRSTDGGESWTQPITALPTLASGLPARFSAYGIAYQAGTQNVVIGSDSGLVVSNDLGATWRYVNPNSSGQRMAIWSVLLLPSGKCITYGAEGIWISEGGFTGWRNDRTGMVAGWSLTNALAVSPQNANHIFFANNWNSQWYSLNGGDDWTQIMVDFSAYDASRQPFIKIVSSTSGNANEYDLYVSNKSYVGKKVITWNGSNYDFSNAWTLLPFAHWDPCDLAFANDGKTLLLAANDGGVEKSNDGGATWSVITKPSNFFNALQVFNVKGVFHDRGGSTQKEIYFGTQDNYFWASSDGGGSWPVQTGNEGFGIQGPIRYSSASDSNIYYFNIGGCPSCRSDPMYRNPTDLGSAGRIITSPATLVRDRTLITTIKSRDTDATNLIKFSTDGGANWLFHGSLFTVGTLSFPIVSFPKVAGPAQNPSIFFPFVASGNFVGGQLALMRYDNMFDGVSGNETRARVPLPVGANLGIVPTMWPWYASYGVDPTNPDFMILPDIGNNRIWKTTNGGSTWDADIPLMDLVTDSGNLIFHSTFASSQVRCIDFDPQNPNHIVVGTLQGGVIYSRDHGNTWKKLPGTEIEAPLVTSVFFENDTTALASTYGRGLVRLYLRETPLAEAGSPPSSFRFVQMGAQDPIRVKGEVLPDIPQDTTGPKLVIPNELPGSAVNHIVAGKGGRITGAGWLPNATIFLFLDGARDAQQMVTDQSGVFYLELPKWNEPRLHWIRAVQYDTFQNEQEVWMPIHVSCRDADAPNR